MAKMKIIWRDNGECRKWRRQNNEKPKNKKANNVIMCNMNVIIMNNGMKANNRRNNNMKNEESEMKRIYGGRKYENENEQCEKRK